MFRAHPNDKFTKLEKTHLLLFIWKDNFGYEFLWQAEATTYVMTSNVY
jgi:hypothetical protein